MHFRPMTDPQTAEFAGMRVTAETERIPGLALDYAGAGKVRLCLRGGPLLWARVERYYRGVWLLRREAASALAVVPPITSREARSTGTLEGWMKIFARQLGASTASPMGKGDWQLTELRHAPASQPWGRSASRATDVFASVDPDGLPSAAHGLCDSLSRSRLHFETWGLNGSGGVFPLRAPSDPEAARVKAFRKQTRDGTLPPILLWWIGAFDMHLLIDGHDRLQAAVAEGVSPRVITLWQPLREPPGDNPGRPAEWQAGLVRGYERAFENGQRLSLESRQRLGRSLTEAFGGWRRAQTTARARPAGRDGLTAEDAWNAEVRLELGDDAELLDAGLGAEMLDSAPREGSSR